MDEENFNEFDYDEIPDFDECDDDDDYFDCGFVPSYGCQLAGSEDCEFDCPYRANLEASPHYPNCDIAGYKFGL